MFDKLGLGILCGMIIILIIGWLAYLDGKLAIHLDFTNGWHYRKSKLRNGLLSKRK